MTTSRPLILYQRFWRREQTMKGGHEQARRSFYKWVCKHDLYGTLEIEHWGEHVLHERGPAKHSYGVGFSNGYPVFKSWRSEAYRQWQSVFEAKREKWFKEFQLEFDKRIEKRMADEQGKIRQRVHSSEASETLRILATPSAIKNEGHRRIED